MRTAIAPRAMRWCSGCPTSRCWQGWGWYARSRNRASPLRPPYNLHQLGDLLPLIGLVAGADRELDAMGDVLAQNLFLDPAQRRAHGRDLRDDVDAVAVLVHHAGEAAHLAF